MAKLNAWQVTKAASIQVYHRNNRMKKWVAHHGSPRDVDDDKLRSEWLSKNKITVCPPFGHLNKGH